MSDKQKLTELVKRFTESRKEAEKLSATAAEIQERERRELEAQSTLTT